MKKKKLYKRKKKLVAPIIHAEFSQLKKSQHKNTKRNNALILFGLIAVIVGLALFLLRVETKNFSVNILNAKEISFKVLNEDSIKSPLCNCPNPSLNNYGLIQFFKEIDVSNSNDTTSFSITSPSPENLSTYPSHQFKADIYILKKKEFGSYDVDYILNNFKDLEEKKVLEKVHLDNLYFFSIIKNGSLNFKFLSNNVISSFLPAEGSLVTIKKNTEKYTEKLESLELRYEANFKKSQDHEDVFMEFFGPKIAIYAEDIFELLGEKGPLLKKSLKAQEELFKKSSFLIVVNVPYTARVSFGTWGKSQQKGWHDELLKEKMELLKMKAYVMENHIPFVLIDSTANYYFYYFLRDSTTRYLPAVYPQPKYDITFKFKKPLNQLEFDSLRTKCTTGSNIFSNPDFKDGVTFYKIIGRNMKLPEEKDSDFNEFITNLDVSLDKAKANYSAMTDIYIKYSTSEETTMRDIKIPIVYYYPEVPKINGIYYYGGFDNIKFKNVEMNYSYGISGKNEINNGELFLKNLVINNEKPYYTKLPIQFDNNKLAMNASVNAEMYVNNERVGERIGNNPLLQNLALIFGILGIGVIAIFKYFFEVFFRKSSKS
jgi:hypothetical protein